MNKIKVALDRTNLLIILNKNRGYNHPSISSDISKKELKKIIKKELDEAIENVIELASSYESSQEDW